MSSLLTDNEFPVTIFAVTAWLCFDRLTGLAGIGGLLLLRLRAGPRRPVPDKLLRTAIMGQFARVDRRRRLRLSSRTLFSTDRTIVSQKYQN